jgi:NhaP-type Na+/H+ or K+/H+ antiporter
LSAFNTYETWQLVMSALLVSAVIIAARFIWMYPAIYVPRWLSPTLARVDPAPPWPWPFLLAYTGIRGIVSLAAALAIPLTIESGQPFPHRDLILFLTYSVILVTLVGQGLFLPLVIRALGLENAGRRELAVEKTQEFAARRKSIEAALAFLDESDKQSPLHTRVLRSLRASYRERLKHVEAGSDETGTAETDSAHVRIAAQLLGVEREKMIELFRAGHLKDEPRRRIERDLDLREAQLANLDSNKADSAE